LSLRDKDIGRLYRFALEKFIMQAKMSFFINWVVYLINDYNFFLFVSGKFVLSTDVDGTSQYHNEEKRSLLSIFVIAIR